MAQATITSYFSNRKRAAVDDFKVKSKVLVLDQDAAPLGYETNSAETTQFKQVINRKMVVTKVRPSNTQANEQKQPIRASSAKNVKDAKQPDLTSFFKKPESASKDQDSSKEATSYPTPSVRFEVKGPLSPQKRKVATTHEHAKTSEPVTTSKSAPQIQEAPKESLASVGRRELSLGEIKTRLNRSSRLAELKESLARLDRGREQLAQLSRNDEAEPRTPQRPDESPRLNKFRTIEVEVPVSPSSSPLKSPQKLLVSGRKADPGASSPTKLSAYQRYAALAAPASPGTPSLVLPYSYRLLAELFRCVDIVVSMMTNRREVVSFKKLKPAVQEMRRRTFTEHHLGQMLKVFPDAFEARQEKIRSFGSTSKTDKFDLVVTPLLNTDKGPVPAGPGMMTPALLAERQQRFYKNLLDITKDHHGQFLLSLEPPMMIPKERVTRWHPKFMVDKVPEITPADLPIPPNQEKTSSAKDVLARARNLFSHNPRMEKALENVAASQSDENTVNVQVVNGQNIAPASPAPPANKPNITSALKGIPKALLEKVRARQAAKALDAMTRSAAQDKEATLYSRLPEIARILRNVFVAEKKSVLPLELVVEKVGNSYRTCLNPGELENHLKLLEQAVPGWITLEHLRKTDFLRLSKNGDMNRVLKKLESLAEQKMGGAP